MDQDDDLYKRLRDEIKQETALMVNGKTEDVPLSVVNRYVNRVDESSSSNGEHTSTGSDSSDDEEEFDTETTTKENLPENKDNPVEDLKNEILQIIEVIEPKLEDLKQRCDERMSGGPALSKLSSVTDQDIELIQEKVQRMTTTETYKDDEVIETMSASSSNNIDQVHATDYLHADVYTVKNSAMPPLSGLSPAPAGNKSSPKNASFPKQQQEFIRKKQQLKKGIMQAEQKLIKLKTGDSQLGGSLSQTSEMKRTVSTSTISTVSQNGAAGSSSRRRRGGRGGKASKDEPVPVIEDISKENQLILTLLSLNVQERDDYLKKIGKERGLLISHMNEGKKQLVVTPKYLRLQRELRSKCMHHTYGTSATKIRESTPLILDNPHIRPFITVPNNMKVIQPKKPKSFENEVTCMLHGVKELKPEEVKKELRLENVSKAEKNTFTMPENVAELEVFVEKLVKDGVGYMIEGVIRINAKNTYQAFVPDSTRNVDCYIHSIILRKCAMEGDLVQVFVKYENESEQNSEHQSSFKLDTTTNSSLDDTKSSESEFEAIKELEPKRNNHGFVIKILQKKHDRRCVGSFAPYVKDAKYIKFNPRDTRIPPLKIFRQNWPNSVIKSEFKDIEKVLYLAEIIDWQDDDPIGNILKSIGQSGDLQVENLALLMEHNLDVTPYSEEILKKLPSSPFQIPKNEYETREDLRNDCVFTIDPLTARDLDDAISCKLLKNGNYEIGVHISDVTYFLEEGSELDEIVKLKATSIYMVDNVYHMLPKPLCFLCSLLPGEDKLAFSVFWEMTPDATIVKTRFARTIINSCTQFAYEHAQMMLENPKKNFIEEEFPQILHGYSPNYISRVINQLQSIAVELRRKRMENGCLKINQPKLSFNLDPESGRPMSYSVYELKESNQLIEDFMLLANISVAQHIFERFPDVSILRSHFPPQKRTMDALKKSLEKHGYNLEIDSSRKIYESIQKIVESSENPTATEAVINVLSAKPMTRARYFCSDSARSKEEFEHFALAVSIYTHFTSPIRRYADVMVHRTLAAALNYAPKPSRTPDELQKLATNCNVQKYNAKLAGDGSSNLYFMHYVKDQKKIKTRASILGIFQTHLEVVLIETGHVVKVTFKTVAKSSKFKITNPEDKPIKSCVIIPQNKNVMAAKELRLFSPIDVIVECKNNLLQVTSVLPPVNDVEQL